MKKPIATIIKAQGIKGEVKLASSVDNAFLLSLKKVYLDGNITYINKIRSDGKFLYVLFDGIADRNAAEALKGKTVYAEKEDIALPKDTYFIDDIIGFTVKDTEGVVLGELKEVYQNGVSADVFVLTSPTAQTLSFPFVKHLNPIFDMDNELLTIDSKIIREIVLYENAD